MDLVQVKHLRKPNGAKPGYVIYENQKTIIVTPKRKNQQDETDKLVGCNAINLTDNSTYGEVTQ